MDVLILFGQRAAVRGRDPAQCGGVRACDPARRSSRARAGKYSARSAACRRRRRGCARRAGSRRWYRPACRRGSRTAHRARAPADAASGPRRPQPRGYGQAQGRQSEQAREPARALAPTRVEFIYTPANPKFDCAFNDLSCASGRAAAPASSANASMILTTACPAAVAATRTARPADAPAAGRNRRITGTASHLNHVPDTTCHIGRGCARHLARALLIYHIESGAKRPAKGRSNASGITNKTWIRTRGDARPDTMLTGQQIRRHSSTHKQATIRPRASGVFFARSHPLKGCGEPAVAAAMIRARSFPNREAPEGA